MEKKGAFIKELLEKREDIPLSGLMNNPPPHPCINTFLVQAVGVAHIEGLFPFLNNQ